RLRFRVSETGPVETILGRTIACGSFHGGFGFVVGVEANVIALELAIKRGAADAEHFAGEGFVTVSLLEDAKNGHALHFRERGGGKSGCIGNRGKIGPGGLFGTDGGRKILDVYGLLVAEGHGAGDTVFEFADVPGPLVLQKALHGGGGY